MSSPAARGWIRMLAVAGAVVALDQASKAAVVSGLRPGEQVDLALGFHLTRVANNGVAFGLLEHAGDGVVLAVTLGALALVLGWFGTDAARPGLWLGVGMLAGGALGNLADRLRDGAVTDFIDPPLWPSFNVADVAITLGVVILVLAAFGESRRTDVVAAPEP
ncbi:MAG: signal peptidase II [Solirubrobacterales bacterium]